MSKPAARLATGLLLALLLSACIQPYPGDGPSVLNLGTQAAQTLAASGLIPTTPTQASGLGGIPQGGFPPIETAVPGGAPPATLAPSASPLYAVTGILPGNVLNVRAEPDINGAILETLPANQRDLRITGAQQISGEITWREIYRPDGTAGWVASEYLTVQVASAAFCSDPRPTQALTLIREAITARDGAALAGLVHPQKGLSLRYNLGSEAVALSVAEVELLFTDPSARVWGTGSGSGLPIEGSFAEVILPLLEDVLNADPQRVCNTLEFNAASGPSTALVTWPEELSNLNYLALYRPAPAEQELDWRTWAFGFEVLDGRPVLTYMIMYIWEI